MPEVKPARDMLLETAQSLISGSRATEYGSAYSNFLTVSDMWTAYLQKKDTETLSPHDVAALMILLKVARLASNPKSWDSWVDIAGYAALGAEVVREDDI